jgi:hypothetical protein
LSAWYFRVRVSMITASRPNLIKIGRPGLSLCPAGSLASPSATHGAGIEKVHKPAAYDRAMSFLGNIKSLFRGKADKGRDEGAAALPTEEAAPLPSEDTLPKEAELPQEAELPKEAELPQEAELLEEAEPPTEAELPTEKAATVKVEPLVTSREPLVTSREESVAASREIKRETRPDPNKPGWGRSIG